MSFYFKVIDPSKDKFPGTPTESTPRTPFESCPSSGPTSPTGSIREGRRTPSASSITTRPVYRRTPSSHRLRHNHVHFTLSNHHFRHHLFREVLERSQENAVGVFESQQYLNLETKFYHPNNNEYLFDSMKLLRESTVDLLITSAEALRHVTRWLERLNTFRFSKVLGRGRYERENALRDHEKILSKLEAAIRDFREKKRLDLRENLQQEMRLIRLFFAGIELLIFTVKQWAISRKIDQIMNLRHIVICISLLSINIICYNFQYNYKKWFVPMSICACDLIINLSI